MGPSFLISWAIVAFAVTTSGVVVADNSNRTGKAPLADVESGPVSKGVREPGRSASYGKGASRVTEEDGGKVGTQPRRLSDEMSAPQCMPAQPQGTLKVDLSPYSLEAKFGCGMKETGTNTVAPDCKTVKDKCCDAAGNDCTTRTISSAVGVGGLASIQETSKIITVKLEDTPANTAGKLHFKCANDTGDKTCLVTVDMPAALRDGQCNFDRDVGLPTISKPDTSATFQCGGTVETKPTEATVFKGTGCMGPPSNLKDLVPGASLTEGEEGAFTLKVAALPTKTQNLCFECVYPDPRTKKEKENLKATCKVTVTVSGGGAMTTTASTTASSAKETGMTWSAVLALALTAVQP